MLLMLLLLKYEVTLVELHLENRQWQYFIVVIIVNRIGVSIGLLLMMWMMWFNTAAIFRHEMLAVVQGLLLLVAKHDLLATLLEGDVEARGLTAAAAASSRRGGCHLLAPREGGLVTPTCFVRMMLGGTRLFLR